MPLRLHRWSGFVLCAVLLAATPVRAHPLVDEGRRAYLEADFDGALRALDDAARTADLDRDELVRLLFTRALVAFAVGDQPALERDLRMLAEIDAELEPGADVPPAVREAFVEVAAGAQRPVRLSVAVERMPGAIRLRAEPQPPDSPLVRSIELRARVAGAPWRVGEGGTLTLPVEDAVRVEYHATALGPGNVAVAHVGEATRPESLSMGGVSSPAAPGEPNAPSAGTGRNEASATGGLARGSTASSDTGGRGRAWLWGTIAGALVIAAAAGLAVALRPDSGDTVVAVPTLEARDR